jgi:hypothetical protein
VAAQLVASRAVLSSTELVVCTHLCDDSCIIATHRKERYILGKLQRGLSAIETWWECRNIKSMKMRFGPSTSIAGLGPLGLILRRMNGAYHSSVIWDISV